MASRGRRYYREATDYHQCAARLRGEKLPPVLEVGRKRTWDRQDFDELNRFRAERVSRCLPTPAAAAGSLWQLDPRVTAARRLNVFFYALGYHEGLEMEIHWQVLEYFKTIGLRVNPLIERCSSIDEVWEVLPENPAAQGFTDI